MSSSRIKNNRVPKDQRTLGHWVNAGSEVDINAVSAFFKFFWIGFFLAQMVQSNERRLTRLEKLEIRLVERLVVDEHLPSGQLGRVPGHLLRSRLCLKLRFPCQERFNRDFRSFKFSLKIKRKLKIGYTESKEINKDWRFFNLNIDLNVVPTIASR